MIQASVSVCTVYYIIAHHILLTSINVQNIGGGELIKTNTVALTPNIISTDRCILEQQSGGADRQRLHLHKTGYG